MASWRSDRSRFSYISPSVLIVVSSPPSLACSSSLSASHPAQPILARPTGRLVNPPARPPHHLIAPGPSYTKNPEPEHHTRKVERLTLVPLSFPFRPPFMLPFASPDPPCSRLSSLSAEAFVFVCVLMFVAAIVVDYVKNADVRVEKML